MSSEQTEYIQLTETYARAIVGYCLTNQTFLRVCATAIKPGNIPDAMSAGLYQIILKSFSLSGKIPTKSDIEQELAISYRDRKDFVAYMASLEACMVAKESVSFDHLKNNLSGWLKLVTLKSLIQEAARFYEKGKYSEAEEWAQKKMQALKLARFDSDERIVTWNMEERLLATSTEKQECCTLGNADFDEMLMPKAKRGSGLQTDIKQATGGCLMPGDMTIFVGPSNAGKTTTMSTIIAANALFGKKVLVVTHEERSEKLCLKFMQSLTGLTSDQISYFATDPKIKERISNYEIVSKNQIHYHEWIKPGMMFVEDVINYIMNVQEKEIHATGKGFDLLVCDYPGKLRSRTLSGKSSWDEKTWVYGEFLTLARNTKMHVVVPVQTNRSGYQVNKGDGDGRMLDQGDVADAFGIVQLADNVITINRTPEDGIKEIVKFHITKSRQAANNVTFASKTSFKSARTHCVDLAGTVMDGKVSSELVDASLGAIRRGLSPTGSVPDSRPILPVSPVPESRLTEAPSGTWNISVTQAEKDEMAKNIPIVPKKPST